MSRTVDALAWALVHFIWQGAAIALVAFVAGWALRNGRPERRYTLYCGALALMLLAPLVTFFVVRAPATESTIAAQAAPVQLVHVAEAAPVATARSNTAVAADLRVTLPTVGKWRSRFLARRLDGLTDEPRPGPTRTITDAHVEAVVTKTLESKPAHATHWSTRGMARATGLSQTAISRIWRAFGLQPHRAQTFKLSRDPQFVAKVKDVVGLYLNPPERAVVLCVDEKSQIQALDRTAPILPIRPGIPEKQTHDYVRHGTTTLFAALEVATGRVTDACYPRHRNEEFLAFLKQVAKAYPRRQLHIVVDNYATTSTTTSPDGWARTSESRCISRRPRAPG